MLSFIGAVWAGAVRTVPCPYCGQSQTVARRPMPFGETCYKPAPVSRDRTRRRGDPGRLKTAVPDRPIGPDDTSRVSLFGE